jgi:hypothetical protein
LLHEIEQGGVELSSIPPPDADHELESAVFQNGVEDGLQSDTRQNSEDFHDSHLYD